MVFVLPIDEPLYVIHTVDVMVSCMGSNLLQNIKESLQLPPEYEIKHNPENNKDEVGRIFRYHTQSCGSGIGHLDPDSNPGFASTKGLDISEIKFVNN